MASRISSLVLRSVSHQKKLRSLFCGCVLWLWHCKGRICSYNLDIISFQKYLSVIVLKCHGWPRCGHCWFGTGTQTVWPPIWSKLQLIVNAVLMLGQRLRRCPSIETALIKIPRWLRDTNRRWATSPFPSCNVGVDLVQANILFSLACDCGDWERRLSAWETF